MTTKATATPKRSGTVYEAEHEGISLVLLVNKDGTPGGPITMHAPYQMSRGHQMHGRYWARVFIEAGEAAELLPETGKPGDHDYDRDLMFMLGNWAPNAARQASEYRVSRCLRPDWRLLCIPEEYNTYNDDSPREAASIELDATTREEALEEARAHALKIRLEDEQLDRDQPMEHLFVVDIAGDLMLDESITAEVAELLRAKKASETAQKEAGRERRDRRELARLLAMYGPAS